jgi:hypothetical protein
MARALWTCPRCGRTFANNNQTHTCGSLGSIDEHFARSSEEVRAIFDVLLAHVEPVEVLAEKTRIAFHLRMSFAALQPRATWLAGHLVLARTATHHAFTKVELYSPRNVLHAFRLSAPPDDAFLALLSEAREVGEQRHLRPSGSST